LVFNLKNEGVEVCGTYGDTRGVYSEDLMERKHLEDLDADEKVLLKWLCKKRDGVSWTGSISLRIGTGGGHL